MKASSKLLIVGLLVAAIAGVLALKGKQRPDEAPKVAFTNAVAAVELPKLVDLGAGKCQACKMMAPILEELRADYAGRFDVVFIDVWENEEAGKEYGVEVIPTQIFYDAKGKELFRHIGFFSKEDILAKWKELKIEIAGN